MNDIRKILNLIETLEQHPDLINEGPLSFIKKKAAEFINDKTSSLKADKEAKIELKNRTKEFFTRFKKYLGLTKQKPTIEVLVNWLVKSGRYTDKQIELAMKKSGLENLLNQYSDLEDPGNVSKKPASQQQTQQTQQPIKTSAARTTSKSKAKSKPAGNRVSVPKISSVRAKPLMASKTYGKKDVLMEDEFYQLSSTDLNKFFNELSAIKFKDELEADPNMMNNYVQAKPSDKKAIPNTDLDKALSDLIMVDSKGQKKISKKELTDTIAKLLASNGIRLQ